MLSKVSPLENPRRMISRRKMRFAALIATLNIIYSRLDVCTRGTNLIRLREKILRGFRRMFKSSRILSIAVFIHVLDDNHNDCEKRMHLCGPYFKLYLIFSCLVLCLLVNKCRHLEIVADWMFNEFIRKRLRPSITKRTKPSRHARELRSNNMRIFAAIHDYSLSERITSWPFSATHFILSCHFKRIIEGGLGTVCAF